MRNLPLILILALLTSTLLAIHPKPTPVTPPNLDTKHVFAFSGLKLRAQPGLQSKAITVIPYGESVELIERTTVFETIEWMSGHWVKVKYGLEEGYVFEGFISDLPVPTESYELSNEDLDIMTPLLSWAEHHFIPILSQSKETNNTYTLNQELEMGHKLTRKDSPYSFKVKLNLVDTKMGDVYNLLRSLLKTQAERISFENKTVFVANNDDYIDRIRIALDSPVNLREEPDGSILITITDYQYGCDVF